MSDKIIAMAMELTALKQELDEIKKTEKLVKAKYDSLGEDFIAYCKANDVKGMKVNGYNVGYAMTPRYSISDEEIAFAYFRSNDMGHLIKEAIHHKTLGSTVKELVDSGKLDEVLLDVNGLKVYNQEVVRIGRA